MRHVHPVILQMYNFGLNFLLLNNREKSYKIKMNNYKIVEVIIIWCLWGDVHSSCMVSSNRV
jgi:CheY-specific phosphatase CheX